MKQHHTIEIFSAGCPLCKHLTDEVEIGKCKGCSQTVYDVNSMTDDVKRKMRDYSVSSVPTTIFDGNIKVVGIPDFPSFYLDALITGTAISSVFFIVASVGMIRVAAGEKEEKDPFSEAMATFASLGFFGLMILLPLLVWPFLFIGAIFVVIVEAITIGIFLRYLPRRKV